MQNHISDLGEFDLPMYHNYQQFFLLAKGIGGRIAVADTENSSAELYDDLVEFEHANIQPPYTPEKFISVIKAAENAGFDTLILDSITHEWSGVGGCLEMVDQLASTLFKNNSWGAWSQVTPQHRKFIDAMLHPDIQPRLMGYVKKRRFELEQLENAANDGGHSS